MSDITSGSQERFNGELNGLITKLDMDSLL